MFDGSRSMKNETDTFFRNVGNHLPGDAELQTTHTRIIDNTSVKK
jgi:hypothetical protein